MDMKNKVIVLDLDDTLYKEIEFLKSGYKTIIETVSRDFSIQLDLDEMYRLYKEKKNVFNIIIEQNNSFQISREYLLNIYRNHFPDIYLSNIVLEFLMKLKNECAALGIITDGRSVTQRNKLKALGIINLLRSVDKCISLQSINTDNYGII